MSNDDPGEIIDNDAIYWIEALENLSNKDTGDVQMAGVGESPHHGHGDDAAAGDGERDDHGDGGGSLSAEQVSTLHEHSTRVQALQEAKSILAGIGGAMGASLANTVDQASHA